MIETNMTVQFIALALLLIASGYYFFLKITSRIQLSLAKHPSLSGHARISRRLARFLPYFEYGADRFFSSDNATDEIKRKRQAGTWRLAIRLKETSPQSLDAYSRLAGNLSDVGFTSNNRVPFPYRKHLDKVFQAGTMANASTDVTVTDLDGQVKYDLGGSYGLNVFGYDFYKSCMSEGAALVADLGPVLGPYHPMVADNVERLKKFSSLDEVSFHMSGTEAVMQAVRLARYHTGRPYLVRMCGAYHGWWDGVQPGVGNNRKTGDVLTLSELSPATLRVLRSRNDIACVLVNPGQALHPNADARSDAALLSSPVAKVFDRAAYTQWLHELRDVCTENGIVLILDEVFTGFRLGLRGAQEYFDVQADLVTYGKTVAGGLPIGVVCGHRELMQRFKPDKPADLFIARGTFNAHPYVMGSMNTFLRRIEAQEIQHIYASADSLWNERTQTLNAMLSAAEVPVAVTNMQSVLSICYTTPSRYNWMYQFYLRAEGLELSWVGTGRLIMCLSYTDDQFQQVARRIVRAASAMNADGWWWQSEHLTNTWIAQQYAFDVIREWLPGTRKQAQPSNFNNKGLVNE